MALIVDQNMLLLMTMPIEDSAWEDAREYLRLRIGEGLKKLIKQLSEEESAMQAQEATEFAAAVAAVPDAACNRRGGTSTSASGGGLSPSDGWAPVQVDGGWRGAAAGSAPAAPGEVGRGGMEGAQEEEEGVQRGEGGGGRRAGRAP